MSVRHRPGADRLVQGSARPMQNDVAHFARQILALHLVLLLLLLGVVTVASREIYNSAHEQAVRQAENRQALLVAQTAKGISEFYQAIFSDLDLLGEAQE